MSIIDLIGVPFDGYGRAGNQTRAAAALRTAGFVAAFDRHQVIVEPDLDLPLQKGERALGSGLMNEPALLVMIESLHAQVRETISLGRFPFVYGADCSVLLGALPALHDTAGEAGLVFVDGHEDAVTLNASPDGEAASMEIALLLGLTGEEAPEALRKRMPTLRLDTLAMLGPRDRSVLRDLKVPTLAERGVFLFTPEDIASDPARRAQEAVKHVVSHAPRWWLHTDLDVLSGDEFSARGVGQNDPALPGGLSWLVLTTLVSAAFQAGGCCGWSLVIYNPDRDPDGSDGRRIVRFVADVAPFI
ncbi:MAG TPA: arginase family protein [Pyrinomonadaceae bacterium]|nr:arginase family protein [Pyrinomonadaceae bacterium]